MISARSIGFLPAVLIALALAGCVAPVTAINPLTGERRSFESEADVPSGWIVCASENTCPAVRPCAELDESSCLSRADCSPVYVGIGAYPRECESPEPPPICSGEGFAGCTDASPTCDPASCGPAPLAPSYVCRDGSVGGPTGRCIASPDGTCGWEIRECPLPPPPECTPDECGPAPGLPSYVCADGTIGGNTGRCLRHADGSCGWEIRDCAPEECAEIPQCDLLCPDGTTNPVDEHGCVHTCECVPVACGDDECGPAPGAPAYTCPDGSIGGNIGPCERNADGVCGWVFRECPAEECAEGDCGPPLGAPAIVCADGSIGGNTGRCLRNADGTCGWELRECPDPCAAIPACELECPPGRHHPSDEAGCVHTCECVPD